MISEDIKRTLDEALAKFTERELAWTRSDRHGRWGVIEPGLGRLLKDSPAAIRETADRMSTRRARRFSSLSRARRFARFIGGQVFRWRRTPPGGGIWSREGLWERARRSTSYLLVGGSHD